MCRYRFTYFYSILAGVARGGVGAFENAATVQMARMIGKVGEVLRSSVEQAIPRERPAVAFGFEYSTMPGWGRSMWCGWSRYNVCSS